MIRAVILKGNIPLPIRPVISKWVSFTPWFGVIGSGTIV
jgi:hypothetical protein